MIKSNERKTTYIFMTKEKRGAQKRVQDSTISLVNITI